MKHLLFKSIIIIFVIFIFSSCCAVYLQLENKDRFNVDVNKLRDTNRNYSLNFGLGDSEDLYHYSSDSLNTRFKYELKIVSPKLPFIKLNSLIFTNKKDRDTIPFILYFRSDYNSKAILIDSLPFCNSDSLQGKPSIFRIIAESSESYHRTKKIYISFDIEVGKERIARKNIEYKRYLEFDCQPKVW
ncbi:MAG: hypothetical protein WCP69_08490 [Bacteroidota bacterium]